MGNEMTPRNINMFAQRSYPVLDQIGPQRRLEPGSPVLLGTIGGRQVAFVRPDQRHSRPGELPDRTIPVTMSRLRRGRDIELDRATTPYRPSMLSGTEGGSSIVAPLVTLLVGAVVGYVLGVGVGREQMIREVENEQWAELGGS